MFSPNAENPTFLAVCHSLEHRSWPIHDDAQLSTYEDEEVKKFVLHFSYFESMRGDMQELLHQWRRLKFDIRAAFFFTMNFKSLDAK